MTKNELLDKIEKNAHDLGYKYHGCTQDVLGAFRNIFGEEIITDQVFKAGSGLCAGVACSGHACGAVTGGVMVISLFRGRDFQNFQDEDKMLEGFKLGQLLITKTEKQYGSLNCHDILDKLTGRHYNCWSEEEMKIAEENGLHTTIGPELVGKVARWTMEILIDEGLVNPADY